MQQTTQPIQPIQTTIQPITQTSKFDQLNKLYEIIYTKYVEPYKELPAQGTDQWLLNRQKSIGGSDFASVIGKGFGGKNKRDIIEAKVGLSQFRGSAATRWGHLFENTLRQYVEIIFDSEIVELTGSIPSERIKEQTYSADGIGVVDINIISMMIEQNKIYENEFSKKEIAELYNLPFNLATTLFEFKCPYSRDPVEMPSYYLPQVKVGMDVLSETNICIYIDAMFKKCRLEQLGNNPAYDSEYHDKPVDYIPLCWGITWVIAKLPGYKMSTSIVDYGLSKKRDFDEFLYEIAHPKCRYDLEYSNYYFPNTSSFPNSQPNIMDEFEHTLKNGIIINGVKQTIIGYIPWKLFKTQYTICKPEKNYIDQYVEDIQYTINIVEECLKVPIEDRKEVLNKYFKPRKTRTLKPLIADYKFSNNDIMELMDFADLSSEIDLDNMAVDPNKIVDQDDKKNYKIINQTNNMLLDMAADFF